MSPLHLAILIEVDGKLRAESVPYLGPVVMGPPKDFGWPWKPDGWIEYGPRYLIEATATHPMPGNSGGMIVAALRMYGPEPVWLPVSDDKAIDNRVEGAV